MTFRKFWELPHTRCGFVALVLVCAFAGTIVAIVKVFCIPSGFVLPAVAAVLAAFVALFRESIRDWIWRPSLEVSYVHGRDFCDTPVLQPSGAICYYFSLRVFNAGTWSAKEVEVFANDLFIASESSPSSWAHVHRYSLNLKWAYLGVARLPTLAPRMERFCNIGHIVDPAQRAQLGPSENLVGFDEQRTIFSLDLEAQPNHGIHLLAPGTYKLTFQVAAANCKPIQRWLKIELTGEWIASPQLLEKGIRIDLMT